MGGGERGAWAIAFHCSENGEQVKKMRIPWAPGKCHAAGLPGALEARLTFFPLPAAHRVARTPRNPQRIAPFPVDQEN